MATPEEEAAEKAAADQAAADKAAADKAAADKVAADQAELEKLRAENTTLARKARIYDAAAPFIKVNDDDTIDIITPPSRRENPDPDESLTPADVEARVQKGSRETASLLQTDQDNILALEQENSEDPLLKENMAIVRRMIKNVDIKQRNPKVYQNCWKLAKGENLPKYVELAKAEGARTKEEEISKSMDMRTRKSAPARTPEQIEKDLTETDLKRAERAGMTPRKYAERLADMEKMKKTSLAGGL